MEQPKVTVEELDGHLAELLDLDKQIDAQSEVTKELNKKYNALLFKCGAYMKELGRTDYSSPHGKFEVKESWRVNMPQSDEDKRALFEHLKERGIFDKYATVNSNSLNALYMADWKEAETRGEGMTFGMPGVPAPKPEIKPNFKPAKTK